MSSQEHTPIQGNFRWSAMTFEEYDEQYPLVFTEIVDAIHSVLPQAQVEHVGSTAIPRLGGRRTLDMVIPAPSEEHEEMVAHLLRIGFIVSPLKHMQPMLTGLIQYSGKEYSILLYIMPEESEIFRGWLAFRAYMQQHPEEIQAYVEVKKKAIADGKTDGWSYQQAKTPYLESLVKRME
jgi:GrpB-like predicted nucleotidyltransferase (UPF0157 family)